MTGIALSFAHTVGEFGVVLMIGGNIPGRDANRFHRYLRPGAGGGIRPAGQTALVLLIFSFVVLSVVYALNRKVWAVGPFR